MTEDISDTLRRLTTSDVIRAHPDDTQVTGDDLNALKSILRGEMRPEFPVNTKRALELLSRSDGSPEAAKVLADTLADADAAIGLRVTAARALGRLPQNVAEPPLIAALDTTEPRLRRAVIGSLGQVGGKSALKALLALPDEPDVAFARLKTALREDSHKGGIFDALGVGVTQVVSEPLPAKEARRLLDEIGGTAGGVALDPKGAAGLSCRNARYAIVRAKDADATSLGIVGAVLRDIGDPGGVTVSHIVLVATAGEGLEIAVATSSGRTDYAGHGKTERGVTTFQLRSTGAASWPLTGEAKLSGGKLSVALEIAVSGQGARHGVRAPQPILTAARARAR